MQDGLSMPEPVIEAAGAVISDGAGRVLLVQRGRPPAAGLWSVPGGSVESGESLTEAAVREVAEETGLAVRLLGELWALDIPAGDGRVFRVHDFAAVVTGGSLAAADDAADARWVTDAEMSALPLTEGLAGLLRGCGAFGTPPFGSATGA